MNFINVAKLICFIYKPNQATIGKDTSETLAPAGGVNLISPAPGRYYFDVEGIRFTFYPTSASTQGPTIEISSLTTNWKYKFRFE
jgi:hypothetical protein